jgi:hypothetical protein
LGGEYGLTGMNDPLAEIAIANDTHTRHLAESSYVCRDPNVVNQHAGGPAPKFSVGSTIEIQTDPPLSHRSIRGDRR